MTLVPIRHYSSLMLMGKEGADSRTLFYLYGYGDINKEDYNMTVNDLAITSLETIDVFKASNGDYLFTLDELQNANISQSQESTDITGRAGRKLSTLKRNKTFTLSASNGLISTGLLAAQTGGELTSGAAYVNWSEELVVNSDSAKTTYLAVSESGDANTEIKHLYIKNSDGTLGEEYEQAASAGTKQFTYTSTAGDSQKTITFAANEIEDDTVIYVIYERMITADQLVVDDDISDVKVEIYVNAIAEDKCANQYRLQIHIPKADMSAEFSIDMGDNQAVHSFEAEALAGKCGVGGNFWEWTVFGVNAEDRT